MLFYYLKNTLEIRPMYKEQVCDDSLGINCGNEPEDTSEILKKFDNFSTEVRSGRDIDNKLNAEQIVIIKNILNHLNRYYYPDLNFSDNKEKFLNKIKSIKAQNISKRDTRRIEVIEKFVNTIGAYLFDQNAFLEHVQSSSAIKDDILEYTKIHYKYKTEEQEPLDLRWMNIQFEESDTDDHKDNKPVYPRFNKLTSKQYRSVKLTLNKINLKINFNIDLSDPYGVFVDKMQRLKRKLKLTDSQKLLSKFLAIDAILKKLVRKRRRRNKNKLSSTNSEHKGPNLRIVTGELMCCIA